MMKQTLRTRLKRMITVNSFGSRKTIRESMGKVLLSSLLICSIISCSQAAGPITNQYITSNGADKKKSADDDGYAGSGGTGDGGGGQGILCSAEDKNSDFRSKLFVRDIFEALYNSKLKIKTVPGPSGEGTEKLSAESIKFLINVLEGYFGPSLQQLEIGKEKFWNDFYSKISFLDEDAKLYPSQDANSPIALPTGCKIVQIAFWDDSTGRNETGVLYMDRAQWKQLDYTNKVALLAHEYFFKEARRAGYKNSDLVRYRLGQIFSGSVNAALFPPKSRVIRYCKGSIKDDDQSLVHLFHIEQDDKTNKIIIPFIKSSSFSTSSLQGREIPVARLVSETLDLATTGSAKQGIIDDSGRGPIKVDYDHMDWIPNLIQVLASAPPELSSGLFPSVPSVVKVSINNPVVLDQLQNEEISKETIPLIIINYIKNALNNNAQKLRYKPFQISEGELMKAYVTLDSEVNEVIKAGSAPKDFPKWETALNILITKSFDAPDIPKSALSFMRGLEMSRVNFGVLLYKVKLGLVASEELNRSLLIPKIKSYRIRNLISAVKDNQKVDFEVQCYNTEAVTASHPDHNILATVSKRTASETVPFKIVSKKFLNENESGELSEVRESITNSLTRLQYSSEQACDLTTIDGCTAQQRLQHALLRTQEVQIFRCKDYNLAFSSTFNKVLEDRTERCMIIHVPENHNYFLVQETEGIEDPQDHSRSFSYKVRSIHAPTFPEEQQAADPGP